MKSKEDIQQNLTDSQKALDEHTDNINKHGWEDNLNAQKTKSYYQGWINALKYVLEQ